MLETPEIGWEGMLTTRPKSWRSQAALQQTAAPPSTLQQSCPLLRQALEAPLQQNLLQPMNLTSQNLDYQSTTLSNNGVSVISRIAGGVIVNDSHMLRKVSPPVIVDEWYDVNIQNQQRLFLAIAKHNQNAATGFNPI
jgi:hypothetical protein